MSHKTVYLGIPASKLNGVFDPSAIASIVEEIMAQYVEETAKEENVKCDWYVIGGRWEGTVGAIKGTENVLLTENGTFAYTLFDKYNVIANKGNNGPYIIEDTEYIPVNGGLKKSIAWDTYSRFDSYIAYLTFELVINKDPRIGGTLPENYEIIDNDLFLNASGKKVLVMRKKEAFSDWADRMNRYLGRVLLPPDAYIDTNGVWHDDNEIWAEFEKIAMSGNFEAMPENPEETAQKEMSKRFNEFLDNELKDDDCFVVLDCHCFP